jgi:diketogulonate reductase-like aldo/keto reductase
MLFLRNKSNIPPLLFGTYKKVTKESITSALDNKIYYFDLAAAYKSEDIVFKAIKEYKNKLPRSHFYFCYKVTNLNTITEDVMNIIDKLNDTFNMDANYIDMLMIHAPNRAIPIEQTWKIFTELQDNNYVHQLAVSNFTVYHLECMRKLGLEMPVVNQIEMNPSFCDDTLIEYHRKNGIVISAYRVGNMNESYQLVNNWKHTMGFQIVAISLNEKHIKTMNNIVLLDENTMKSLKYVKQTERTCQGSWSDFDFTGDEWKM